MNKSDQYPLFVHWYKTLNWLLDTCEKMPKSVRFSLSGRIATLSLDIQEAIVEAIYTAERLPVLHRLNLHLEKLRVLLRISYERKYLSHRQFAYIAKQVNTAGKMVGGWIKT